MAKFELQNGEELIIKKAGNIRQLLGTTSGDCYITNKRIVFISTIGSVLMADIPLDMIDAAQKSLLWGIKLFDKGGKHIATLEFVGRGAVLKKLEKLI